MSTQSNPKLLDARGGDILRNTQPVMTTTKSAEEYTQKLSPVSTETVVVSYFLASTRENKFQKFLIEDALKFIVALHSNKDVPKDSIELYGKLKYSLKLEAKLG